MGDKDVIFINEEKICRGEDDQESRLRCLWSDYWERRAPARHRSKDVDMKYLVFSGD